jgi:hypothetical protein
MNPIEREATRLTAMLAAAEEWPALYSKTPAQHGDLIKAEAEMQVILTRLFRDMAKKANDFVNWNHYNYQSQLDYNVEVIVNDQQIDQWDGSFIKVTLKTVNRAILAGALASEINYKMPLGVSTSDALIQRLTTKEVAALVGKRVQDDGSIVDNPDAKYNVLDTVRNDIAESVKTSLALGETTDEATDRIAQIINPVGRAELIAQTESVNAYNRGVDLFGDLTQAVGEEWMDAGAKDRCREFANRGVQKFGTGWDGLPGPTAHPRCRCAKRLVYQEEWERTH